MTSRKLASNISAPNASLSDTDFTDFGEWTPQLLPPASVPPRAPSLSKVRWSFDKKDGNSMTKEGDEVLSTKSHRDRIRIRRTAKENMEMLLNAKSDGEFWRIMRTFTDPKTRSPPFTVEALRAIFEKRMNAEDIQSAARSQDIPKLPNTSIDPTTEKFFSKPFELEEVQQLLYHLESKDDRKAPGPDKIPYSYILRISAESLLELYNACVHAQNVPRDWLHATVVGILKKNKDLRDPENYRIIGLECCLLKGLMWLIESRIRMWAVKRKLIPDYQNGFIKGKRTNNNGFILRTAIEQADFLGKRLYVAFVDLQNAFPSVNHNILWDKLWNLGCRGPLFDIVRSIYSKMSYSVTQEKEESEVFSSNVGILAGDPCSPLFWLIFAADCTWEEDKDDVSLSSGKLRALFHADDLALLSYSEEGLQRKIDRVLGWCRENIWVAVLDKTENLLKLKFDLTLRSKPKSQR